METINRRKFTTGLLAFSGGMAGINTSGTWESLSQKTLVLKDTSFNDMSFNIDKIVVKARCRMLKADWGFELDETKGKILC